VTDAAIDATPAKTPGVVRFIGIDWNFGELRRASKSYWSWIGLLLCVFAVGVTGWLTFFTHGGSVMAMRDGNPWGLWFTDYMYYVGLAAGGLAVYASVHLFGAEQFKPLSRIAVLQAGVFTMLALLGVLTDFERPWRMISFVLTPNPTAPFVYTGTAAGIYMVLCFADLWVMITGKGGEKLAFTMTLIALPFAIYLHTTTAFVLALNKSRELWNSAVMVPIFLTSATASGIAALIIFAYIMQAVGRLKFKPSMFRSLSTMMGTVMILDLFLLLVELLTIFWPTSQQPGHSVRMMQFLFGSYAFTLWPLLILGFGAFFLISNRKLRHLPAVQITASAMYVVAVFIKRYMLMGMGFVLTPLGQPTGIYVPSFVEICMALGILAFGLLLISLAIKVLPVEVPDDGHSHAFDHEALDQMMEERAEAKRAARAAKIKVMPESPEPSAEPEVAS
jgi:Ni/Fe-hydrogenase subunit HybB-like protein